MRVESFISAAGNRNTRLKIASELMKTVRAETVAGIVTEDDSSANNWRSLCPPSVDLPTRCMSFTDASFYHILTHYKNFVVRRNRGKQSVCDFIFLLSIVLLSHHLFLKTYLSSVTTVVRVSDPSLLPLVVSRYSVACVLYYLVINSDAAYTCDTSNSKFSILYKFPTYAWILT